MASVLNWRLPAQAVEPIPTTRTQAITRGLPRYYFTGKPCHAGHIAERGTVDRTCVECCRSRQARERESVRQALKGQS